MMLKFLTSVKVLFESIVITSEGVGVTHGRRAVSDRDMRSERPEFERCALCGHMALVSPRAKKKESNRKLTYFSGLPGSVVKAETANA